MKSKEIEIKKISFTKFEFNVGNEKKVDGVGNASMNLRLPERDEGQENQILLLKMNISYSGNQYQVSTEIDAVYSVSASDLPEDVRQDEEFQQFLVNPMIEKFRLYVGLFSEGVYGAIQIPDLNFNQE
ncbi:hypothetical protein E5983_01045 [Streptococcus danieliae]|uniref:Preprotein translocase subunit SecB n=1 Tax=Streptococcus danieliae TaxID=747656 RepID=A0A7X3G6Y8_9STRE|nr:hypothetical protein [Streptococcus danieliae]MVX58260.1 hypothetical protein [Streptococcus danieliae]